MSNYFGFCLICSIMAHNVNKAGQTHDQLQAACYKWACQTYHPYIYRRLIAIPNDMHAGNVVRWKQYQALGVTPGVWDMQLHWITVLQDPKAMWPLPYKIFPAVFWWEFKVGSDKLSTKKKDGTGGQIEYRDALLGNGHVFNVASEEDQFQQQFKSIIEPTLEQVKRILDNTYGVNKAI